MRMLAPCVGIGRARDDLERAGAVAQALASGVGHNHGALAIRFKRYEFHGDASIRGEFSRKGRPENRVPPQVG
jgi:hypothetical protein